MSKSKANPHREPIPLTGRVYVSGALADKYTSNGLVAPKYLKAGDLKLWCHMFKPAKGQDKPKITDGGLFRAAVYDGKKWRTFRLNIIADTDARYGGDYNDWVRKAGRVIDALRQQKDRPARWHENTYGVLFTKQATPPPPVGEAKPRKVAAEAPVPVTAAATVATAARQAMVPFTASDTAGKGKTTLVKPAPKRRRKRPVDPNQLTLGFAGGEASQ